MASIFERVRKITVEQLGVDDEEIVPSANFVDDLGADSLDLIDLMISLEEEFSSPSLKVEIPDEDAVEIETVQDAVDYISDLGIQDV